MAMAMADNNARGKGGQQHPHPATDSRWQNCLMTPLSLLGGGGGGNSGALLSVDGNNKNCGADAGSLPTAVIVGKGSNGMEPMELIGVNKGCGKDVIAAAAINCHCSPQWQPLLLLMTNDNRWLLVVVVINCVAVRTTTAGFWQSLCGGKGFHRTMEQRGTGGGGK